MRPVPLFLALLAAVAVAVAARHRIRPVGPDAPGEARDLPTIAEVPPFSLTDATGRPFARDDLAGTVWVADFIFTRCAGPCPELTRRMAGLQRTFRDAPVRLVSVTVDPEWDTPPILAQFAAAYGADPARWHFLTGPSDAVHALARDGFLLGGVEDVTLHSTRLVLVDAAARIRGYYDGRDPGEVERLHADLTALLAAAEPPR